MHVSKLIGKYALRTRPAYHNAGGIADQSYSVGDGTGPVKILKVDEADNAIHYEYNSYNGQKGQSKFNLKVWGNDWVETDDTGKGLTEEQIKIRDNLEALNTKPAVNNVDGYFYEIVKNPYDDGPMPTRLSGPCEGILPVVQSPENDLSKEGYLYVQVFGGRVTAAFKADEFVITKKVL